MYHVSQDICSAPSSGAGRPTLAVENSYAVYRGERGSVQSWFCLCPPKELWAMSRVHWRQTAQKRRKKMGSSVVYKTRGTFLSQNKRHEDACG